MLVKQRISLAQTSLAVLFTTYLSCFYIFYDTPAPAPSRPRPRALSSAGGGVTTWASMGLCYSHNTELLGKGRYPYRDVAVLSLLLWRHHAPQVRTLLRIVHTEPALSSFMRVYGEMLERAGAVVEWVPAGDMDCVLKSQLVRSVSIHNTKIILSYV